MWSDETKELLKGKVITQREREKERKVQNSAHARWHVEMRDPLSLSVSLSVKALCCCHAPQFHSVFQTVARLVSHSGRYGRHTRPPPPTCRCKVSSRSRPDRLWGPQSPLSKTYSLARFRNMILVSQTFISIYARETRYQEHATECHLVSISYFSISHLQQYQHVSHANFGKYALRMYLLQTLHDVESAEKTLINCV
jgi:hypothetical protein